MSEQQRIVQAYLQGVQEFSLPEDALAKFLQEKVEFIEYPNLINRHGQKRNLEQALKGLAVGRTILTQQNYEIQDCIEKAGTLFLQARWTGKMAVDAGPLKKDQILTAHCAMRFEFENGKIIRQTNYDCYDPF